MTDSADHRRHGRVRRLIRTAARVVVVALATWGLISIVGARPGIGQFRSVAGQRDYRSAYAQAMTALPPPTRTADVATDLGTVRAYLWSSPSAAGRTPVLLLPGRTSGVPMWSENLAGLLAHHSVIAVDALGDAGLSVQSTPLASIEDQALWIDEVVRRLAPDGVHLVGHSFGGSTAATYARLHPERVSSLVLLEPVFTFGYPAAHLMAWTVLASLPVLPESWRERALAEVGGGERADPDDPIATMISAGAAHYSAQLPNPRLLTDAQLAELSMPVYVAIADSHSLAGGSRAAERARQLPDATVEVWPETTHSLPMQVAGPLDERLQQFWVD
jgi:pimeloyl-ACP methyl ester carboxylesterase